MHRSSGAAAAGAAGHHQALPGRGRQRRTSASAWRRARSTRCSARTAPASRTLVKIIYGVLHADEGEMLWDGRAGRRSPTRKAARALGIGMVFQHFSLFEAMTVLENVALGVDGVTDMRALATRMREVSHAYGLPLEPEREVHTLSVGERQRIEIVRCLLQNPKLLIMDEPTSVLTPQEVDKLFETLRQLAAEGVSILYISHKLHEIKALCDRATILRGGKVVGDLRPQGRDRAQHGAADDRRRAAHADQARRAPRWARSGSPSSISTCASEEAHGVDLKRVGFEVRAGEIMGIAGVAGNGQNELMLALSGERTAEPDTAIRIDGKPVGRLGAAQRRALGLCCVPEERNGHAAVPEMSLADNAVLSGYRRMGLLAGGFIRGRQGRATTPARVIREFDVRTPGVDDAGAQPVGRQPAEVHRRPRGAAGPRRAGRLAADLGRRRRRRRGDPPGADHAGRQRRGRAGGLAGPGRAADAHRPARRDQCRRAVRRRMPTASASVEEIGLLMGGAARHDRRRAAHGGLRPCRLRSSRGAASRWQMLYADAAPGRAADHASTGFFLFLLHGLPAVQGADELLRLAADQLLRPVRAVREGGTADHDRGRPRHRLSRQCLEHRRRGPAHHGRPRRRRASALAIWGETGRLDPAGDAASPASWAASPMRRSRPSSRPGSTSTRS